MIKAKESRWGNNHQPFPPEYRNELQKTPGWEELDKAVWECGRVRNEEQSSRKGSAPCRPRAILFVPFQQDYVRIQEKSVGKGQWGSTETKIHSQRAECSSFPRKGFHVRMELYWEYSLAPRFLGTEPAQTANGDIRVF